MSATHLSRRRFLQHSAVLATGAGLASAREEGKPLKIACVYTEARLRSHPFNFLENFLEPLLHNGKWIDSGMTIASLYADQSPEGEMSQQLSKDYKIPLFKSIGEALTLGGKELAVDGVMSIVEHGNYPVNDRGVREYPRKRFFDEIAAVMKKSGRGVPIFNDKHFAHRWDWSKEMYDTAASLKAPLMAGSSVPLAARRPALELPEKPRFTSAVAIHGGPFEVYDFHGLEVLQSFVEFRVGGETGVKSVQYLSGEALWKAADAGLWSIETADAAMAAELGPDTPTLRKLVKTAPFDVEGPWGILVTYRDGLRGIVLKIGKNHSRWSFACRLVGEDKPRAATFYPGPWGNRNLFMALSFAVQEFFRNGMSPYPVERTLLTTGLTAAAVDSHFDKDRAVETPHLKIAYASRDFKKVRENGESWKVMTEKTPQPKTFKTKPKE